MFDDALRLRTIVFSAAVFAGALLVSMSPLPAQQAGPVRFSELTFVLQRSPF